MFVECVSAKKILKAGLFSAMGNIPVTGTAELAETEVLSRFWWGWAGPGIIYLVRPPTVRNVLLPQARCSRFREVV